MKNRKIRITCILLCFILILFTFCGCSSGKFTSSDLMSYSTGTAPAPATGSYVKGEESLNESAPQIEMPKPESPAATADSAGAVGGASPVVTVTSPTQKIIYSVYLDMETIEYDASMDVIQKLTAEFGGSIESSNFTGRGVNGGDSSRYANYVLRIPVGQLNNFLEKISTAGSIVNQQNSGLDVTDQYFDVDARLKTLKISEERLLVMLQKTGELKDMIELEKALSETRYQIESYEGTMRRLESHVSFSTVTVNLREVAKYTPVNDLPKTLGERIRVQFEGSITKLTDNFENFAVWLVGGAPLIIFNLLIFGAFLFVIIIIIRVLRKHIQTEREKHPAYHQAGQSEVYPPQDHNPPEPPAQQ